jgi:hypothetical protein
VHQDRHVQLGAEQGLHDAQLVAEVRQHHHDAVYPVALGAEEFGAEGGVLHGLDRAVAGGVRRGNDVLDAELVQRGQELRAGVPRQFAVEDIPGSDDQPNRVGRFMMPLIFSPLLCSRTVRAWRKNLP